MSERRRYKEELDKIRRLFQLDYESFARRIPDRDERVAHYERVKDQLIRGEVVLTFLMVDEFLNLRIDDILLPEPGEEPDETREQLSEVFSKHILLQLPPSRKIAFVDTITPLPQYVKDFAWAVTNMRHALAHEFYIREDERRTRYKGKNIYTREGLDAFIADADRVRDYLYEEIVGEPSPD